MNAETCTSGHPPAIKVHAALFIPHVPIVIQSFNRITEIPETDIPGQCRGEAMPHLFAEAE